jgi:hypothetical protein
MDIETKVELTFNVRLGEDEMDLLAKVLYAAMIYKEDAMDGAAEDALISAMKALPEDKLFYVGKSAIESSEDLPTLLSALAFAAMGALVKIWRICCNGKIS